MSKDRLLVMRDLVDQQLETSDQREIGRVADVQAEWRADGSLVLTHLVTGPQALAARVASRLRPVVRLLLRDRFEHAIVRGFRATRLFGGRALSKRYFCPEQ